MPHKRSKTQPSESGRAAASDEDAAEDPADLDLVCPIAQEVFTDPVRAADGRVYERWSIIAWLEHSDKSPLTREKLKDKKVTACAATRKRAEEWRRKQSAQSERALQVTVNVPLLQALHAIDKHTLVEDLGLTHPTVVCLGLESCGKSTLLERVAGCPVLPRGNGTCTRMVVRVLLRRQSASSAAVWTEAFDGSDAHVRRATRLPVTFDGIPNAVTKVMADELERCKGSYVTDRVLYVEIRHENAPRLDLVDLPGLVAYGDGHEVTFDLAKQTIVKTKDSACFLWVQEASMRPNVSPVASLVSQHKLASRTVGILTKVDLLHPEDDSDSTAELLVSRLQADARHGGVELKPNGWYATALRPDKKQEAAARTLQRRFAVAASKEDSMGKKLRDDASRARLSPKLRRLLTSRFGVQSLLHHIQDFHQEFVRAEWLTAIRAELQRDIQVPLRDHVALGVPFVPSAAMQSSLSALREAREVTGNMTLMSSALKTCDDGTIAMIAAAVIREALRHRGDWLSLAGCNDLWALVTPKDDPSDAKAILRDSGSAASRYAAKSGRLTDKYHGQARKIVQFLSDRVSTASQWIIESANPAASSLSFLGQVDFSSASDRMIDAMQFAANTSDYFIAVRKPSGVLLQRWSRSLLNVEARSPSCPHDDPVTPQLFNGGQSIVCASEQSVHIAHLDDAKNVRSLSAAPVQLSISHVAVTPDGSKVAVASGAEFCTCDTDSAVGVSWQRLFWREGTFTIGCLAYRPDGKFLVVGYGHCFWRYDQTEPRDGSRLVFRDTVSHAVYFPDQQKIAVGLCSTGVCIVSDGSHMVTLTSIPNWSGSAVTCVALGTTANNKVLLACGARDGSLHLWNTADSTKSYSTPTKSHPITAVAFTPQARHVSIVANGVEHTYVSDLAAFADISDSEVLRRFPSLLRSVADHVQLAMLRRMLDFSAEIDTWLAASPCLPWSSSWRQSYLTNSPQPMDDARITSQMGDFIVQRFVERVLDAVEDDLASFKLTTRLESAVPDETRADLLKEAAKRCEALQEFDRLCKVGPR